MQQYISALKALQMSDTDRAWTRISIWLFLSLAMVALLSPLGATHDEVFHATNIWCGRGERSPFCEEIESAPGYTALTNLNAQHCKADPLSPLICPLESGGNLRYQTNPGLYPSTFYSVLSWFVFGSVELSLIVVRLANALVISLMLALMMAVIPTRHRVALALLILTAFNPTGFYLFSSIHPSSWTAFGVGTGWIGIHAALTPSAQSSKRRALQFVVGVLICLMGVGSRWDAYPFMAVVGVLVISRLLFDYFPTRRATVLLVGLTLSGCLGMLLQLFSSFKPSEYIELLVSHNRGQPDNLTFFSHYLLQGLPNALSALGSVPTHASVVLPQIVQLVGVVVLGCLVTLTIDKNSPWQWGGALLAILAISVTIMSQVALIDNRDFFGVEPRYSYPLLLFLVGWWYLFGSSTHSATFVASLRPAAVAVTITFALSMFTVAERYTDRQTLGLRLLPEESDNWWWQILPVSPNVVLVLAVIFMWNFLRHLADQLRRDVQGT